MENIFFEILRLGLGTNDIAPRILSEEEWEAVIRTAKKQALTGITFVGMQKMMDILKGDGIPESEIIPRKVYLKWLSLVSKTFQQNEKIDESSDGTRTMFRNGGFDTCILKGRGIAGYYGELSNYRQSGDVDIWVWPKADRTMRHGERMRAVVSFLCKEYKCKKPTYHNTSFHFSPGIEVEAHYTPSWMYSPLRNRRLQKWFESQAPIQMRNEFPTLEFNRIYILLHIYRHLLGEGVGLRQIVDYYFVLHTGKPTGQERRQTMKLLGSLGLGRFTSALMWILHRELGLDSDYLLCEPDGREGAFLLSEMLKAGNFGKYDKRIPGKRGKGKLSAFSLHVLRNFRFVTHYPSEVLWCPLWKVWHQLWMLSTPRQKYDSLR